MRTRTLTPLKLTILEAGFTQREISRRSGIDESVLSLITNGRYLPDELQRAKIAEALGRTVPELFDTLSS